MTRILMEGWRGVSHSYAMVNQHQILALAKLGHFEIFHRDLPFLMAHWNEKDTGAGFSERDARFLADLPGLPGGDADIIYRIGAPIPMPTPSAAMAITFMVTEFGLDEGCFADSSLSPGSYTTGRDLVVTPSRWSRDRLLDYGFAEEGVRVVGHGVDQTAFYPLTNAERQVNRSNLDIASDVTVFLNIGAPLWNKGIDLLLEAYAHVHRRNPRTRLILKDGNKLYGISIESTLRDLAVRHPELMSEDLLASITCLPGNLSQAELRLLYGVCDWYVSPYRAEGFNLPVLEALACGKPVIVTSGGATDDFCHGAAVHRIPSIFHRGLVGTNVNACRLEPHLPSLIELMAAAANEGPNRYDLSESAVAQAGEHGWARAANDLRKLFDLGVGPEIRRRGSSSSISPEQAIPECFRSMHIYCDGGFGNRFNTLVSGLLIAKAANLQPIIVWPRNNWCGAGFEDLFENDFSVIDRELVSYYPDKEKFHFFMTEDHIGMGVENRSPLNFKSLTEAVNYLQSDARDVYYHSPLIPSFLDASEVLDQIRGLKINSNIVSQADEFIRAHGLSEFLGVQIRKTDFGSNSADDNSLFSMIGNASNHQFFVCSDDKEVESRFTTLPNVVVYAKRAHVDKLVEGDWNSVTLDHSGRAYACNVNRSALSVIDAVVDCLILSYSTVVRTSNSTFLNTALLLQSARR